MNLVNAGIKSKKELAERMMNGEALFLRGVPFAYNEEHVNPFRVGSCPLNDSWALYRDVQKEAEWFHSIDKPVLCLVSDKNVEDFYSTVTTYIASYDSDAINPFISAYGLSWRHARPVTVDDLIKDII